MRILLLSLLVAGMSGYVPAALAAGGDMTFRGKLIEPPPCTVNNGNGIPEVDFGNKVGVKKVNGINYIQDIKYNLVCDPNLNGWALKLKLTGNKTGFDDAAVQTNITDLGIQIQHDGQRFVLGSELSITPGNIPKLQAVPVQKPGATLTEGPFDAAVTLQADYQ